MKVLVTGANGFLGYYLVQQLLAKDFVVIGTGKGECRLPIQHENFFYEQMDITEPFSVSVVFEKQKPGIVVHMAAMTKPDDCEQEQWKAYTVNVEGTLNLLLNAETQKCFFILVSTDFVFNGEKGNYCETDERDAVNFYGKTKVAAEEAVEEYPFDRAIVRTALVYGQSVSGRDNIAMLVKKKLEQDEKYSVFTDQVRTPTYVEDLAKGIVAIIGKRATGIFHIAGEDILTPYEIACAVAGHLKLDRQLIIPVTEKDMKQPARRPAKTDLDIEKARRELKFQPVSFAEGLRKTFPTVS